MRVKLNDLVKYPVMVNFRVKGSSGQAVMKLLRMVPDRGYEIHEELADDISQITRKVDYSEDIERQLLAKDIPYDIVRGCGSCGGKRKKIQFSILEVID